MTSSPFLTQATATITAGGELRLSAAGISKSSRHATSAQAREFALDELSGIAARLGGPVLLRTRGAEGDWSLAIDPDGSVRTLTGTPADPDLAPREPVGPAPTVARTVEPGPVARATPQPTPMPVYTAAQPAFVPRPEVHTPRQPTPPAPAQASDPYRAPGAGNTPAAQPSPATLPPVPHPSSAVPEPTAEPPLRPALGIPVAHVAAPLPPQHEEPVRGSFADELERTITPEPPTPAVPVEAAAPATCTVYLNPQRTIELVGAGVIGRNPRRHVNPVAVEDPSCMVSNAHVEFVALPDGLQIVDLGSSNGTTVVVDGAEHVCSPGSPVIVPRGGSVRIGEQVLVVG